MKRKASLGRQKIKLEKIGVQNHLQVTFSKRRSGLFKKASELSTLCGIHIAVVVFSPAKKVFSFGHPDMDSVVERYEASGSGSGSGSGAVRRIMEARREVKARELNEEFSEVARELEEERRRGVVMEEVRKSGRGRVWFEDCVEQLGIVQLQQLGFHLEHLKMEAARISENLMLPPPHGGGGGESLNCGASREFGFPDGGFF